MNFNTARILLFTILLTACLLSLPNAIFAQISLQDRAEMFEEVWQTINQKYYDPNFNGVNWAKVREQYQPRIANAKTDTEFYSLVKQMVGELGDLHTNFWSPLDLQVSKGRAANPIAGVGVAVTEIEGKTVVYFVAQNSPAAQAGLQSGLIITAIDGRDVREVIAEKQASLKTSTAWRARTDAFSKLFDGEVGTPIEIGFLDQNGVQKKVSLVRTSFGTAQNSTTKNAPKFSARRLPSGIGYIRFDEFAMRIVKPYKNALKEFKETKGLIIDLRYNPGGDMSAAAKLAGLLLAEKVSFGKVTTRDGKPPKIWGFQIVPKEMFVGGKQLYRQPVVILTSSYSSSGSEFFAKNLQEAGRARIVGRQSCGCLLGVIGKTKIKGGELYLSQVNLVSGKGERVEGTGVTPDFVVEPKISDLKNNFTRTIDEAEKLLLSGFANTD